MLGPLSASSLPCKTAHRWLTIACILTRLATAVLQVSHPIDVAPLAAAPTRISDGKGLQDTATATTTTDNSSPVRSKAGTKATRAAPTHSDDGLGMQDTAADQPEPTATVAVMRRDACPKVAKPQAANTPAHMKQLESEVVKADWQQYELLRACRLQNQNCDWYRAIYN